MMDILFALGWWSLGLLCFPLVMFLRARRSDHWDDSNMLNMYRVIAYIAVKPEKLGELRLPDGKRPFWYINKDENTDVAPPKE